MTEADKYLLRVTAGPSYDPATHVVLPINTPHSTLLASPHCTAQVQVRVQNYRGLPRSSPTTSPYFAHPRHTSDQYSIAFAFAPHTSVSGADLVFGNDFDRPIRDRLPPGFGTALRIVQWMIDPGLDGDVYADQPHLYGPLLSSANVLRVARKARRRGAHAHLGEKEAKDEHTATPEGYEMDALGDEAVEEGADGGEAEAWREASGCPDGSAERQKWALGKTEKDAWDWEAGRVYQADFSNGYLDFNEFALRLPGFSLGVLPYLGGKDDLRRTHDLRYVLKNKETGDVFFVVVFTLVLKEDVEKEEEANNGARKPAGAHQQLDDEVETSADDLD